MEVKFFILPTIYEERGQLLTTNDSAAIKNNIYRNKIAFFSDAPEGKA
jgi:hypothetical protein